MFHSHLNITHTGWVSGLVLFMSWLTESQEVIEWVGSFVFLCISILAVVKQIKSLAKGNSANIEIKELIELYKESRKHSKK